MKSTFLAIVGIAATSAMSCSWDSAAKTCSGSSENQACKDAYDIEDDCADVPLPDSAAGMAAIAAIAAGNATEPTEPKEGCVATDMGPSGQYAYQWPKAKYCAKLACTVDGYEERVTFDVIDCRVAATEAECTKASAKVAERQTEMDTPENQALMEVGRLMVPAMVVKLKEQAKTAKCSSSTALCISAVLAVLPIFASLL